MKRTLLCVLAAAAAGLIPARADFITLSFSPTPISVGSTFTMDVAVTDLGGDNFVAFGMNPFISDPSKAVFIGATVDPALNDDSDFFGGSPAIAGDAFPPVSAAPVELATLTFEALATGPVTIGVTSDLSDPNQGLFLLNNVLDLTTSQSVDIVPEPAVLVPLSLLVGGLYFRARKVRT